MISANYHETVNESIQATKASVDELCLDILRVVGIYAEIKDFSIVGLRAIVFAGREITINFVVPDTVPKKHRKVLERIALEKVDAAEIKPDLNFIYTHCELV